MFARSAGPLGIESQETVMSFKYAGKVDFPIRVTLGKGLEGAITNESEIGYVDGQEGKLVYRGYDVADLAEHANFEETAYLLVFGTLPNSSNLKDFKVKLRKNRKIHPEIIDILKSIPNTAHPMSALEVAVSALGTFDSINMNTPEVAIEMSIKLISKLATITAYLSRIRKGQEIVEPNEELDHSVNFMYMLNGEVPDELTAKLMDMALILHADHGMNASTFTSMVVASTLSDMYSAITAGICSLKGPLHGGANEFSLENLLKLKSEKDAKEWVQTCIREKRKIMGFGHRIYKVYDPRALIFKEYAKEICSSSGNSELYKLAETVEAEVVQAYGSKGIFPNVDFYSGLIYHSMGINSWLFTPIFAVSRVAGWVARILEYLPHNRIFRPRAAYVGDINLEYIPMEKRQ